MNKINISFDSMQLQKVSLGWQEEEMIFHHKNHQELCYAWGLGLV